MWSTNWRANDKGWVCDWREQILSVVVCCTKQKGRRHMQSSKFKTGLLSPRSTRSGHWFATSWHLFYTPDIEVFKSVTLFGHSFQAYLHFMCDFQGIWTLFDTSLHHWGGTRVTIVTFFGNSSYLRSSSPVYMGCHEVFPLGVKRCKRRYTAMVKDPFKEWDRVDTFLHFLSTWVNIQTDR